MSSSAPLYPFAGNLIRDEARLNAVIQSLGVFLSQFLRMRYSATIDTHQSSSHAQRARALKLGLAFHELIDEDNEIMRMAMLENAELEERRQFDADHKKMEDLFNEMQLFCREYNVLLMILERFCSQCESRNSCLNLLQIAAPSEHGPPREISFFRAVEVHENSTGEFTLEVRRLIEGVVEEWLSTIEQKIKDNFDLKSGAFEEAIDRTLAAATREELASMISNQISMVGLYTADMKRNSHALRVDRLEELCKTHFGPGVRARCKEIQTRLVNSMTVMKRFCMLGLEECIAEYSKQHSLVILDFVRTPPRVLVDRPGYAATELHLEMLGSIVKRSLESTPPEVVHQLFDEWSANFGRAAIKQFLSWLNECIGIIQKQEIPESGFIPTLRYVRPPPPPWRTIDRVWAKSDTILALMPMQRSNGMKQQYLPIPDSVHASLRLVSLVWELVGFHDSYDAFFSPGEVLCCIVRNAVISERVTLQNTSFTLSNLIQALKPGANYRRAVCSLAQFRQDPNRERELRTALQILSKFPLHEIVTAASERSSLFRPDTIMNMVTSLLPNTIAFPSSWVVRRAMENALPIICQLRREITFDAMNGISSVAEALMSVRKVREWRGQTPELIITLEDAKEGVGGLCNLMKDMSKNKAVVHFGRLPRRQNHGFGNKEVFKINGLDFRKLLEQNSASYGESEDPMIVEED